ncbi:PIR Superfamily Protein [Plasmodium ovale curtisi]|uniref:PIR Superfamily Protein n=1 Tax=Plasmodium ovale curtisi TaxID=864141 RepID=A0A1A8WTV2_PLAOA|nr:PIR Superfamily Protein [Plasmodium ovale curtisi]SBT01740.1 PIR Superfamily Protein [Plasmodium ovale curtisi]
MIIIVTWLLFIYKFAPFESLLHSRLNSSNSILNNLEEETQNFLNSSKEKNVIYGKEPYNIVHNTVDYS